MYSKIDKEQQMTNLLSFIVWLPNITIGNVATGMGVRKVTGEGGSLLTE